MNKPKAADLYRQLSSKVAGQNDAIQEIVPFVELFEAGLSPEGRPAGIFLLLGPTGTGKTRTVEALAESLHGSARYLLKVDCGEYQMEHEVAKLIGAPPGYLGHKETQPVITQAKLNSVASEACNLSLVLFDEVEKSAKSLAQLLLGVLDKGVLRLGDGSAVNFERSLIFFTSNAGAREMAAQLQPGFGFARNAATPDAHARTRLENTATNALRKHFAPEFLNRIDSCVTYKPLDGGALAAIMNQQVSQLQQHVASRLGACAFRIQLTNGARQFLLDEGTSEEYGARELKRVIHKYVIQPIGRMVSRQEVPAQSTLQIGRGRGAAGLKFSVIPRSAVVLERAA